MSQHPPYAAPVFSLSSFYFAYFTLIGAFMPYWSLYLEHQGYSKAQIGTLATVTVLTRLVAPGVWGWLADRSGRRMRWVRLGVLAELVVWLGLLALMQAQAVPFALLVLILLGYSFFQNAILAQFEAVTLVYLQHDRARYGVIRQWGSLGFIVAVAGLGGWFDWAGLHSLPAVMAVLAALGLLAAYGVPEVQRPTGPHHTPSVWPVLRHPAVWRFFVLEGLLLLSHAPFYSFYSNYLAGYGYATGTVGLLWTLGVLAEMLMFQRSRFWLAHLDERVLLALCLGLTSLRWAAVGLWPEWPLLQALVQLLHAFSFALFQVLAMQRLSQAFGPGRQGRAQGLFSMVWGLGVAGGSWLAGQGWDRLGGPAIFGLAALVALLGTAWVYWVPVVQGGQAAGRSAQSS